MQRQLGRRSALLIGIVGAALTTMGASQCGTTSSSTVTVSGGKLTIYSSATGPFSSDVVDAEKLALRRFGSSVGKFTINFVALNGKPSANARTAIQDKTAIAYLGELQPGVSAGTMGITNSQDLLQVSPTDTALALTQSTPAVSGAPDNYYEAKGTYGKTFARVVPSSAAEARAQVALMESVHVRSLYVANDGSAYGKAIAYAVKQDAATAGITVAQGASGADAVFLGGGSLSAFHSLLTAGLKLFAPSGLASDAASLPAGTYVTEPGLGPKSLTASARSEFINPFKAAYGHAPATQAIFGYEAMAAVLAVLGQAGSDAGNRSTVVHDFFALKRTASVLGTYSIDSNGDPNISPFVVSRVRNGALVPLK